MAATKQDVEQAVREVASSEVDSLRENESWRPGFWANFPWLGFAALCTIFCCMAASAAVLFISNNMPEEHWHPRKVTPSVWLSGFNNISSICFGIMIANGCAVAWWRRLLKGATIQQLHASWTFSSSVKAAALAGRSFNIIAMAALTAKLTIIDGMLMQKATSTALLYDFPYHTNDTIFPDGDIRETIPKTGIQSSSDGKATSTALTKQFNDALKFWSTSGPLLPYGFEGCELYCFVNVPAAGFEFDCDEQTSETIDFGMTLSTNQSTYANGSLASAKETLFNVSFTEWDTADPLNFTDSAAAYSVIRADFVYSNSDDVGGSCPGTRYTRSCRLRPALVSYPIMLQTSRSSNKGDASDDYDYGTRVGITEDNYLEYGVSDVSPGSYDPNIKQVEGYQVRGYRDIPSSVADSQNTSTRLGGIVKGLDMYLGGSATLTKDSASGLLLLEQDDNAPQFLNNTVNPGQCGYEYVDPMEGFDEFSIPGILERINEIMFTFATDMTEDAIYDEIDNGNFTAKNIYYDAVVYSQSVHYQTNYHFMAGALASTLFCLLCVLPTYWGFWQLGRKLALSPLEIAAAFRSPLVEGGKDVNGIIKDNGERKVAFGYIVSGDGAGQLGVADGHRVQRAHPSIRQY